MSMQDIKKLIAVIWLIGLVITAMIAYETIAGIVIAIFIAVVTAWALYTLVESKVNK